MLMCFFAIIFVSFLLQFFRMLLLRWCFFSVSQSHLCEPALNHPKMYTYHFGVARLCWTMYGSAGWLVGCLVGRSVRWMLLRLYALMLPYVHDDDHWCYCIRCNLNHLVAHCMNGDHVWKIISTKPLVSGVISSVSYYILHERWVALYFIRMLQGYCYAGL